MKRAARLKRSRNLDDAAISEIVSLLDGWTGPLSWNALIAAIEELTLMRYTRQTLGRHERITLAISLRREALKAAGVRHRAKRQSREFESLLQINSRLQAKCERLERENTTLLEQFMRWACNARNRGVSEEILDRALPEVNRGSALERPTVAKSSTQ